MSYLILPRPTELVVKPLFIVLAVALAAVNLGENRSDVSFWGMAWFVLLFEAVGYQARYCVNDARDNHEDWASDPDALHRLPNGEAGQKVARVGFIARIAVLLVFAWYLPGRAQAILWVGLASILLWAILYEFFKSMNRRWSPGASATQRRNAAFGIAAVSGLGYGTRVVVGALLVAGSVSLASCAAFFAFGTAIGAVIATMSQAIRASTKTGLAPTHYKAVLMSFAGGAGDNKRVLEPRSRLTAPWSVALVVALATGVAAGAALFSALQSVSVTSAPLLSVIVVGAYALGALPSAKASTTAASVIVLGSVIAALAMMLWADDSLAQLATQLVPPLLATLVYCVFRRLTPEDLDLSLADLIGGARSGVRKLDSWVFGGPEPRTSDTQGQARAS